MMLQRNAQSKYYTVINHLGQVVLPAAVLVQLGIDSTSDLAMYIEGNAIVLRRVGTSASRRASRDFEPAVNETNHIVEETGSGGCPAGPPLEVLSFSRRKITQERLTPCRITSSSAARGCTT
ncbi:MAG: AbrB/MazE/SpoVT family DNA-binding domain-containing protein [Desulfurispora sp.]|uniref:AbrB/MazE/SpoVT family DNA-binding domain-containing protein n=1 Tax=Desulfurispora sp. TaxID=3014275 RepID=UPI00404ABC48